MFLKHTLSSIAALAALVVFAPIALASPALEDDPWGGLAWIEPDGYQPHGELIVGNVPESEARVSRETVGGPLEASRSATPRTTNDPWGGLFWVEPYGYQPRGELIVGDVPESQAPAFRDGPGASKAALSDDAIGWWSYAALASTGIAAALVAAALAARSRWNVAQPDGLGSAAVRG